MFNKRISDLPVATILNDNDIFPVVQDNTTRQISFVDLIREVNAIVEISFTDLRLLILSGELSRGTTYQVDFQTKHVIPNTSPAVINTGTVEKLLLYAVSNTELLEEAISIDFPQDMILFDIDNVLCEDGVTARDGKITYRKDRTKNLEAWYDFRKVKYRRWDITIASSGMAAWTPSTNYYQGSFAYSGNVLYRCVKYHMSGASFND